MKIRIGGYENNRPVITTYRISDMVIAEAVASSKPGIFIVTETLDISKQLDVSKQYALVSEAKKMMGLIMFLSDPTSPILTTCWLVDWEPDAKFQIHDIEELSTELDY